MVNCCVPSCNTSSSKKGDPAISFYPLPSDPDVVAKWIRNINTVVIDGGTWYPRDEDNLHICSKHFLPTDFDSNRRVPTLKRLSVPTLFANILGFSSTCMNPPAKRKMFTHSPMIVKINKNALNADVSDRNNSIGILNSDDFGASDSDIAIEDYVVAPGNIQPTLPYTSNNQPIITSASKPITLSTSQTIIPSTSQHIFLSTSQPVIPSTSQHIILTSQPVTPSTSQHIIPSTSQQFFLPISQPIIPSISQPSALSTSQPISTPTSKSVVTTSIGGKFPKMSLATAKKNIAGNSKDVELIEIGPNTFLKINPKLIKVVKKKTASGNSVLQFIMNSVSNEPFKEPEIITLDDSEDPNVPEQRNYPTTSKEDDTPKTALPTLEILKNVPKVNNLDGVIGHIVNTSKHNLAKGSDTANLTNDASDFAISSDSEISDIAQSSIIKKAPMLLSTGVPLSQCMNTSQRLMTKVRQKDRALKASRNKISRLQAKLEAMENKCIVQDRELSFAKVKKMKAIRIAAAREDPAAVFIIEQIKGFERNSVLRWSDTTLRQCGIWCRKAPYAYEYFKKAELFKLPCMSTVKRFMKKCPPEQLKATASQGADDDSSSDFNFNTSNDDDEEMEQEQDGIEISAEALANTNLPSEQSSAMIFSSTVANQNCNNPENINESAQNDSAITSTTNDLVNDDSSSNGLSVQVIKEPTLETQLADADNLSVQEVVLPEGIMQCLNSKRGTGQPQYFIIPSLGDQTMTDHQYSVLQSDSGPLIIQNVQNSQLPLGAQEQVIFITHSADDDAKSK